MPSGAAFARPPPPPLQSEAVIQYSVDSGGVHTVCKRDLNCGLPLHCLFLPPPRPLKKWEVVEILVDSYPEILEVCTLEGHLPLMITGESASLDVIFCLLH